MASSSSTVAAMEKEYRGLLSVAESFSAELSSQILKLLDDHSIALGFPIQRRVKTWESLTEKFERVKINAKSIKDVQELIGLRVILLFRRDVSSVCRLIEENLTVVRQYNTQERLQDNQFGYSSIHFIVEIPEEWLAVPTLAPMQGLRAEIQVRTIAQHIWAEASQALQYKHRDSVPVTVSRAIHRVSALLETIDLEFERVLEQRDTYRADVDISGTDDLLNVDLLEKTLDSLLPLLNKDPDEDYSSLMEDLTHFKISTQKGLRDLITRNLDSIMKVEKFLVTQRTESVMSGEEPLGTTKERTLAGVFFTHVGLAREALQKAFGKDWYSYLEEKFDLDLEGQWDDDDDFLESE